MSNYKYLFSPIKIGNLVLPNRIHFAAHMTNFAHDHKMSEKHVYYYRERAKGGCGLITTEELSVHPTDMAYEKLVEAYDPKVIPSFKAVTNAIHEYETKIFAQLNHNGIQGSSRLSKLPLWGPSPERDPIFRETSKEMEIEEIHECVEFFAKSAENVREGGFDGIEVQMGHSSLIRQFLSPATNKREDEYGGTLENRMRFCFEVLASIRKAVGDDYVVGVRLNADEMHPKGGLTIEDAKRIAKLLETHAKIDFIDLSLGTFYNLFLVEGSMHTPLAYTVPLSSQIKSVVDLPVFCTNRINDPILAESILRDGHADIIGMVRALICDPHLPVKAREGRTRDIRYCIACNQGCIGRMGLGYTLSCVQNPAVGNEKELGTWTLAPTKRRKKIVIVGGGPAGLEAARVLSLRGHKVVLLEKENELGGQNLIAGKVPSRREITGVTRFLSSQLKELKTEIHLDCNADLSTIKAFSPDIVIVATGSLPKERPYQGQYGPPEVQNVFQVLRGEYAMGIRILLIDQEGHHQATSVAEFLARQGKSVHIVTPMLSVCGNLGPLQDYFLAKHRLYKMNVLTTPDVAVLSIEGRKVTGVNVYTGEFVTFEGYDNIIIVAGNRANDQLYFILKDLVETYRIGDAVAPRKLDSAIWEGYMIGRRI
ncbi:MAG: mycofactocin system FadH/OYE family oxidoreductase 2 [candidate division WOR-3 bacterium]